MVQQRRGYLSVIALAVGVAVFLLAQLLMAGPSQGQEGLGLFGPATSAPPPTDVPPITGPATSAPTTAPPTTAPPTTGTPPTSAPPTSPPPTDTPVTEPTTVPPPTGDTVPDGVEQDDPDETGDGTAAPGSVPADAQAIIDAYPRTAPNSSKVLLAAVQPLIDLGLPREEAIRIGFGSFPIAGESNFVDDWLFPRGGANFRFHQGTDVFAPYGTPLRAVADGVVTAGSSNLGGISVRVTIPDGTFFYYAHLSALPDDFVDGATVSIGDIVGFVGDSGNARGGSPHLHFGIYAGGGKAINPKPFLDDWLAEAAARLPEIIAATEASLRAESAETGAAEARVDAARGRRSMLASSLLRAVSARTAAGAVPTDVLYQASANPSTGGVAVAETEAARLAASIDWQSRASAQELGESMVAELLAMARTAAGPLGAN